MSEAKWWQESDGGWRIDTSEKAFLRLRSRPDGSVSVSTSYGFGAELSPEQWATLPLRPSESPGVLHARVSELLRENDRLNARVEELENCLRNELAGREAQAKADPARLAAIEARLTTVEARLNTFDRSQVSTMGLVDPKLVASGVESALSALEQGIGRLTHDGDGVPAGLSVCAGELEALLARLRGEGGGS